MAVDVATQARVSEERYRLRYVLRLGENVPWEFGLLYRRQCSHLKIGPLRLSRSQNTKSPKLHFRALLNEKEVPGVELMLA